MNWLLGPIADVLRLILQVLIEGADVLRAINRNLTLYRENTAMNLDKLNQGVTAIAEGMDAISAGIAEVRKEVGTLQLQITGNTEAQATVDRIGDLLINTGGRAKGLGDELRNLLPDAQPAPGTSTPADLPPVVHDAPGVTPHYPGAPDA
jgi:hypothetical protein